MNTFMDTVRAALAATAERWMGLAQAMPVEALSERPAPGEWSAIECLQHIVDSEKVLQFRLQAFQEGRDFPEFNPDTEGSQVAMTPQALVAEFVRLRRESLAALEKIGPADLERKARHARLGPVTLGQMVNEWVAHDLNHTMQAEEALMQPFIRASGPWQVFFAKHVIEG
jgi:hypothetical protein